jgi:hypothetical protein
MARHAVGTCHVDCALPPCTSRGLGLAPRQIQPAALDPNRFRGRHGGRERLNKPRQTILLRLPPVHDRLNHSRRQKCQPEKGAQVPPLDPLCRRDLFGRILFSEKPVKGTTHRISTQTASGAGLVARMS